MNNKWAAAKQSYRLLPAAHGLSHALKNSPPDCFSPRLRRGRAFKSVHLPEKAECFRTRLFLAGALGLEPRAYGFGDRRSTN